MKFNLGKNYIFPTPPDEENWIFQGFDEEEATMTPTSFPGSSSQQMESSPWLSPPPTEQRTERNAGGSLSDEATLGLALDEETTTQPIEYCSEADLQGLVSNILDESESWNCYSTQSAHTENTLGPHKLPRSQNPQFSNAGDKLQMNFQFSPRTRTNHLFDETQEGIDEQSQQLSGFANKHSFFSFPTGDGLTTLPHKLPPGLSLSSMLTNSLYNTQQNRSACMPTANDSQIDHTINNFLGPHIFQPQHGFGRETNGVDFNAFSEVVDPQASAFAIRNGQHIPDEINQLTNYFQYFTSTSEDDEDFFEESLNTNSQTFGICKEHVMGEKWKHTSAPMPTPSIPGILFPIHAPADRQGERSGGKRKQPPNPGDYTQFNFCPTENRQHVNPLPSSTRPRNYEQNRPLMSNGLSGLNNIVQPKHHMQQDYTQRKNKPQQRQKKAPVMSETLTNFPRMQQSHNREAQTDRQPLLQRPYANFTGKMLPPRLNGGNNGVHVENGGQPTANLYPLSCLQGSFNSPAISNVCSWSPLYNKSGGIGMGSVMPANANMESQRGNGGFYSTVPMSFKMHVKHTVLLLSFCMDDCYEQWRCLVKERKKIEDLLRKMFPGNYTSTTNPTIVPPNSSSMDSLDGDGTQGDLTNMFLGIKNSASTTNMHTIQPNSSKRDTLDVDRTEAFLREVFPGKRNFSLSTSLLTIPPNSSRIDALIANHLREQEKVVDLLETMKNLSGATLSADIQEALKNHGTAATVVETKVKQHSRAIMQPRQNQIFYLAEDREFVTAVKNLAIATRKLSSAMWVALQVTLPKPPKNPKRFHDYSEVKCTDNCSTTSQPFNFKLDDR